MDLQAAEKAIRDGAIGGFFVAGTTAMVVVLATSGVGGSLIAAWNDPAYFIDVVTAGVLSIGLLRRSRTCAVLLFLYFLVSKILFYMESGHTSGLPLTVFLLLLFGRAIKGTFVYHNIQRALDPDYKSTGNLGYILLIPMVLAGLALGGLAVINAMGPPTHVVTGAELAKEDIDFLFNKGIVDRGEKILMFYSSGLLSAVEEGNILTDRRLISYEQTDGQILVASATFDEIKSIAVTKLDGVMSDTALLVTRRDGSQFHLVLSAEDGGDKDFIDELAKRVK